MLKLFCCHLKLVLIMKDTWFSDTIFIDYKNLLRKETCFEKIYKCNIVKFNVIIIFIKILRVEIIPFLYVKFFV